VVEVGKAVARANPAADPQPVLSRIAFVELDAELARVAASTGTSELRALDAIHIASALRLGPEIDIFLTYDERQTAAARDLGFTVVAPGQ
jgi:predicted nucleic acid-binding protein